MNSFSTRKTGLRLLLFMMLSLFLFNKNIYAQNASQYGFTAVSGTFTDIAGTTGIVVLPNAYLGDDNTVINAPIGFPFIFCGTTYNAVAPCTNGWISFNPAITTAVNQWTNTLANLSGSPAIRPALMPLWDDLGASSTSTPVGEASYVTTGAAPNRVFTFQYKNWQWTVGSGVNISFQVKLYETTNIIEYIYRPETGAGSPSSATIGIVDAAATATYLTLNNAGAAPVPSSTTFTTGINTKPANGQIYRFTPPPACNTSTTLPVAGTVAASPGTLCMSGNVTLNFTPATAMPAVTGITYKWQTSPTAAGTYTDIPGAVTTLPTYTTTVPITAAAYFKCVVLCNGTTTVLTSSASNVVNVNNPGVPTVTPGSRCGPGVVALSATPPAGSSINWYANPTGGAPLATASNTYTTGYLPSSTTFYAAAASGTSPGSGWVGNGTTYTSGQPNPFYPTFMTNKIQFLVKASELVALGLGAGTVNSIGFDVATVTAATIPINIGDTLFGLNISMKTTTANDLTTTFETGLTPCFSHPAYKLLANQIHNFSFGTPFPWDGTSNVIIEVCFAGPAWGGTKDVKYTTGLSFQASHYQYADNSPGQCTAPTGTNATTTSRPNIKFDMTLGCTGARVPVLATVNPSPVVGRNAPAVVCNNSVAAITLTPPTPAYPNYNWTPAGNLFTNAAATTPYVTGNSATSVYMKTTNVGQQTYYMMAGNPFITTGCTFADTVKVWVQPGNVTIKGQPDTICVTGSTKLSLDTIAGYYPGSIQWQTSTNGVNYTDIAGATNPVYITPVLSFGQNTYYKAVIKAGTEICQSPVKYVVIANPTIVSAPDSFHCGPGQVTLSAITGGNGSAVWYSTPTGGLPIGSGNPFVTPYLGTTTSYYVSSGGGGSAGTPAVGAGALTSSTQGVTPFSGGWGGSKHQYIIRAAELNAAGVPAGAAIKSLGFEIVTGGTAYPGFAISMKNTATAALPAGYETGLFEVRSPASYTPTTGINTLIFTTPYVWDGSSNLVIQTCWSNGLNVYNATGSTLKYDNTPFIATKHGQTDNITAANMCSVVTPGYSTNLSQRPKFFIGYDNRCESAREEVIAYIRPVPEVDLGEDINKCIDEGFAEVLDAGVQANTPQFLWDNGSNSQVRAVTESGSYHVTVTNQYTCKDSDTINVILRANPIVNLGNDTTVCNGVILNLNPGNNGIEYFWNTGQTSQNININSPGTYSVFVTNSQGCTKADTIVVNMQGELPSIQGIQASNNGQYTFTFSAVNPQNVIGIEWDFGDGSPHSYLTNPTHTYATDGNYTVIVYLSSTCGFDSDTSSAHILGINQLTIDKNEMTVYPNPTRESATILNRGALRMEHIEVYNVLGQVIYEAKADSKDKHTLRLNGFASGVYTVQIFTDKGTVARKLEIIK